MTRRTVSRRQFAAVLGTAVGVGLAGCGAGVNNSTNATNETVGTIDEATEETDGAEETESTPTETPEPPETTDDPAAAVADGSAVVRVAHLSPDAPNVDVSVGGADILTDVAYGAVSDYYVLEPDTYTVAVAPTGEEDAVFEQEVTFSAGATTVAALGELAEQRQSFAVEAFEDRVEEPGADTTAVRAVHASPDAPTVDVAVQGGDTLLEGVAFGEASDYVEVPAGEYTLDIVASSDGGGTETGTTDETETDGGTGTDGGTETGTATETVAPGTVLASVDVALAGETVVSAFATGYVSPEGEAADAPFELLATVDAGASMGGTGTETGTGTESGTEGGTETESGTGTETGAA